MYPPESPELAPEEADEFAEVSELARLMDVLGNGIEVNTNRSVATVSADEAKKFAAAALDLTTAFTALFPYEHPDAPNPRGDNPAKRGD